MFKTNECDVRVYAVSFTICKSKTRIQNRDEIQRNCAKFGEIKFRVMNFGRRGRVVDHFFCENCGMKLFSTDFRTIVRK